MIIDCCIFWNELDMLEARLEYLNDHVDYFVVVESNYTFDGNEKPFHIKDNMDRFERFKDKLIYYPFVTNTIGYDFTRPDKKHQLAMERKQRNAIADPLDQFAQDDVVIFGNVNDIPNRNKIQEAANYIRGGARIVALQQEQAAKKWNGTLVSSVQQVRAFTPQLFRDNKDTYPSIDNGGWCLQYDPNQEMLAILSQLEHKI